MRMYHMIQMLAKQVFLLRIGDIDHLYILALIDTRYIACYAISFTFEYQYRYASLR